MAILDEDTPRWVKLLAAGLAVLVAAVIGLVVTLVIVLGDDDSDGPSTDPTSPETSASTSVCGLSDGGLEISDGPPVDGWEVQQGFAVPQAAGVGPGRIRGGVHSCFARSVTGALFSAVYYYGDSGNPALDDKTFRDRFSSDPHTQEVLDRDKSDDEPSATQERLQVAGYRVVDASEDRVVIDLVLRLTETNRAGDMVAFSIPQVWERGDWKVLAPPGADKPQITAVQELVAEGYTAWGAL